MILLGELRTRLAQSALLVMSTPPDDTGPLAKPASGSFTGVTVKRDRGEGSGESPSTRVTCNPNE